MEWLGMAVGAVIAMLMMPITHVWRGINTAVKQGASPWGAQHKPRGELKELPGCPIVEPANIVRRSIQKRGGGRVGEITLWVYAHEKYAERAVRFTDPLLVRLYSSEKLHLSKMPLDMATGIESAVELAVKQTLRDLETYVNRPDQAETHRVTALVKATRKAVEHCAPAPEKKPDTAAPRAGKSKARQHGTATMTMKQWVGTFISAGLDDQTIAGRSVTRDYIDLRVPSQSNAIVRQWGVDLPRALADAGAQPGDLICLALVSQEEPTDGSGSRGKKIYEVTVLSRNAK